MCAVLNRRGERGGRPWQAGEKRILPVGRDPCRRSKSVQIHGGGSRPIPALASRSFRFHLQARRRSEWPCAYRRMRAPTRATSRPTFRSAAARRTGRARTSSEVRQIAKSEGSSEAGFRSATAEDRGPWFSPFHLCHQHLHRLNALPMAKFPRLDRPTDEFLTDPARHHCPPTVHPEALNESLR